MLRRRLLLAGLLLTASGPVTVLAQDTPARPPADPQAADVVELEEVRVTTGTHIRRQVDQEGALPITVMDFSDLEAIDASSAIELFEELPQAGFSDINESNTLGADARGDVSSINLRGIGSGNSLVLLNGRRIAPHPISQSENRVPHLAVNVNSLPVTIVERVEVLRDGASAVYGADAAAGVLNTITRTDYNRTQASFRIQLPEQTGADESRVTLSHGTTFNDGRTYVAWAYTRLQRDELRTRDREFSANADSRAFAPPPWDGVSTSYTNPDTGNTSTYTDNDWDNRSLTSPYGHWIVGAFNADGEFVGIRPSTGINTSTLTAGGLQARVSSSSGGFYITPVAEVDGDPNRMTDDNGFNLGFKSDNNAPSRVITNAQRGYFYNLNDHRTILPDLTRDSFYSTWTHKFNNGIEAFGDFLAYHSKSVTYREPIAADSIDDPNLHVPAQNPWNPFGVRFYHPTGAPNADGTPRNIGTPRDLLFAPGNGARLLDFGERVIHVKSRSGRAVAGLRGRVFDTWDWESAVNYGFAKTQDQEYNGVRESRLVEALARSDESAFNPFGRTFRLEQVSTSATNPYRIYIDEAYTNPQSLIDDLTDVFERIGRTTLFTWDAKVNGDITNLWAGTMQGAAGVEYRYETYEDWRPPYAGINPPEAVAARPDLFREGDNDFIALSPNTNIDASRNVMSAFGEVLIPLVSPRNRIPLIRSLELSIAARYETFSMFGDTFKPKVSLAWRPTTWLLARASYNESFRAPNLVQTNPDPIQRSVSGIQDYYRQGIPGATDSGSRSRKVFRGGNPDLSPETADTLLFGFVVEPPFLKGISFSLDHFRLNQKDVIDAPTGTQNTRLDEEFLAAAARIQTAAGVPINQLSAYAPDGSYLGNPYVIRTPPSPQDLAAFFSYNSTLAAGDLPRVPVGPIDSLINNYRNIAGRDISGYDLSMNWRAPRTKLGRFTFRVRGTYLARFDELLEEGVPMTDNRWKNNNPKWRGNMSLTWRFANVSTGISAFYYGSRLETSAIMGVSTVSVENMQARYEALGSPHYIVPTLLPSGEIRYYYKVPSYVYFNTYLRYNFRQRQGMLRNAYFRIGILNLGDDDPPATDVTRGYRGGTSLARGRTFNFEVGKRF